MLTVPVLSKTCSYCRQSTIDQLISGDSQSISLEPSFTSQSVKELGDDHWAFSEVKHKKVRNHKRPALNLEETVQFEFNQLTHSAKENLPPGKILPSPQNFSPESFKKASQNIYESAKIPSECFSPKYMKRKEENEKILQSLKLENQRYKRMITENAHLFSGEEDVQIQEFNLFKTEKLEPKKQSAKKKSEKRKALEQMTTNMTSSFIFQDLNPAGMFCAQPIANSDGKFTGSGSGVSQSSQTKWSVDDFDTIKYLGKGNFGEVNLVRHRQTSFICAMKSIKKSFVKSENVIHQISRQIRIHQSLKHLNVIGFYGFFDDSENVYIMTEYATGGQLYKKLKECYRMPEDEIVPIVRNAIDGLKFIHSLGYIHRDIKPENMIFQFGIGKICDLGWAADCGFNETRNSYCGTPLYLSPEMVKKEHYDKAADVWSIGILTYELLVGKVPFNIWSEYDLKQIVEREINFPTSYVDITEDCMNFITKCLNKNPADRIKLQELANHPFLLKNEEILDGYFNCEIYDTIERIFEVSV